jgi:hypothetical protein
MAGIRSLKESGMNYQKLMESFATTTSEAAEQIEKVSFSFCVQTSDVCLQDLKRTFATETEVQTEANVIKMRNILRVYSCVAPSIGYCQSMNCIPFKLVVELQLLQLLLQFC